MKRTTLPFLVALALATPALAQTQISVSTSNAKSRRQYFNRPRPVKAPFSDAVLVNDTLYVSGNIGLTPDGKVPANIDDEIRLVLDNFDATLKSANMTMDDLVSVQVFCSDVSLFQRFNAEYMKRFHGEFPARSFLGSGTLLFNAHFEINGVAVKR